MSDEQRALMRPVLEAWKNARPSVSGHSGRAEDPTAVAIDSQSVRAANNVPAATTGLDVGKKTPGRKGPTS